MILWRDLKVKLFLEKINLDILDQLFIKKGRIIEHDTHRIIAGWLKWSSVSSIYVIVEFL